ncbi:DUF523 domain-containing protein [Bacillus xiapuensis]|uniref:DUF523 domain-containing protein n=1 Tax=Bacillus xiapuensis TaxID=2014075 RepID=UPI000C23497D|nr:DUF523 domain-containing protein [Bacillus xiapuensis]
MLIISACLVGEKVRYDGCHCLHQSLKRLMEEEKAVAACPELMGGCSVPREPAEIIGGGGQDVLNGTARVLTKSGEDVTDMYLMGARLMLQKAQEVKADLVILKENSPSCGSSYIYNGEFTGKKVAGNGVTAALLKQHGFRVAAETDVRE